MPADTSPTMRPVPSRTGAIARIDGPSVPVYTSVNVSPRSAGSMVPRYFPPICVGSVWVNRVRSGAMIVMNAMSVFLRTASVTGCKVSVALPDSIAAAVDGRVGQRGGDAEHLLARGGVTVVAGVEQRQRAADQHHHRDHQDLQGDRLSGQ